MAQEQRPPKLLTFVRDAVRMRGYSPRTKSTYADWIKRYLRFCKERNPRACGYVEVQAFATRLVSVKRMSPSTQHQAISAVLFLYRNVLGMGRAGGSFRRGGSTLMRARASFVDIIFMSPCCNALRRPLLDEAA